MVSMQKPHEKLFYTLMDHREFLSEIEGMMTVGKSVGEIALTETSL